MILTTTALILTVALTLLGLLCTWVRVLGPFMNDHNEGKISNGHLLLAWFGWSAVHVLVAIWLIATLFGVAFG